MDKEIIIVSDSHGRSDLLRKIEEAYPNAYLYLHCGDLEDDERHFPKWVFVQGNNDYYSNSPEMRVVPAPPLKILMTHSHRMGYGKEQRSKNMAAAAWKNNCEVVCYGHTHVSDIHRENGILEINPGSLWLPRDGNLPSYARLLISDQGQTEAKIIFQDQWPFNPDLPEKEKKRWFHW